MSSYMQLFSIKPLGRERLCNSAMMWSASRLPNHLEKRNFCSDRFFRLSLSGRQGVESRNGEGVKAVQTLDRGGATARGALGAHCALSRKLDGEGDGSVKVEKEEEVNPPRKNWVFRRLTV